MPLHLLLADVGAGKTSAALRILSETLRARPFARAWVLLANRRQEDEFRDRLIALPSPEGQVPEVHVNVEFFSFYTLNRALLHWAAEPFQGLGHTGRFGLLRLVIARLADDGQLPRLGAVVETPGFVQVMADLIDELKQNRVDPARFTAAADARCADTPLCKDREIARIYAAYQAALRRYRLVDTEGEGWLALARTADSPQVAANVDLLLVDGYDQFTRVQTELLTLLAARVGQTLVTLTTVPGRETTIGRRFETTRRSLHAACESAGVPLTEQHIAHTPDRHPQLDALISGLFTPGHVPVAYVSETDGLHCVEAPDPASETQAVLRRVKRLLLTGTPPDGLIIALRDFERYAPHLRAIGQAYGVPLSLHRSASLLETPPIAVLFATLRLHSEDFPRRALLDVLRSPYIQAQDLDADALSVLERVSLAAQVQRGAQDWLDALVDAHQQQDTPAFADDDEAPAPLVEAAEAEEIAQALESFFALVTPPQSASVGQYVEWLERLIGHDPAYVPPATTDEEGEALAFDDDPWESLRMIAAVRALDADTDTDALTVRDLAAFDSFRRLLNGLLTTEALLDSLDAQRHFSGRGAHWTWAAFFAELRQTVESLPAEPSTPSRTGRVLVTTAAEARGLPHTHVFVMGLSEGVFPQAVPEDRVFLDSEREAYRALGVPLLSRAERAADEGLFYDLCCLARGSLTLTRPNAQNGAPWPESHLWRGVLRAFEGLPVTRYRAGDLPPVGEVASREEAALAAQAADAESLRAWLRQAHPTYWAHVQRVQQIEAARMDSVQPHDAYSGVLADAGSVEAARAHRDSLRGLSASAMNDYAACPFRYFARRLLTLDVVSETEAGMDSLQQGQLLHRLLEMSYRRFMRAGLDITPESLDAALSLLHDEAAEVLDDAPRDFGFRAGALWPQERAALLRLTESFVRHDFADPDNPIRKHFPHHTRRPYRVESFFGDDPAVPLTLPSGRRVALRGVVDRIDLLDERFLVVIDYKTGATTSSTADQLEGREYQLLAYAWAAEAIRAADPPHRDAEVLGGLFWTLRQRKGQGVMQARDLAVARADALHRIDAMLDAIGGGDFRVDPSKPKDGRCKPFCEYVGLCRLAVTAGAKPG